MPLGLLLLLVSFDTTAPFRFECVVCCLFVVDGGARRFGFPGWWENFDVIGVFCPPGGFPLFFLEDTEEDLEVMLLALLFLAL